MAAIFDPGEADEGGAAWMLVGAGENAPVDVLRVVAEAVLLVGGKLRAGALERAFVGAGEVSLHRVAGKKGEPAELEHLRGIEKGGDAFFRLFLGGWLGHRGG